MKFALSKQRTTSAPLSSNQNEKMSFDPEIITLSNLFLKASAVKRIVWQKERIRSVKNQCTVPMSSSFATGDLGDALNPAEAALCHAAEDLE